MLVYIATNRMNDKEYIGQTVNSLKRRKQEHIRAALNKTDNMYFHKSVRKYGQDNFDWEILHNDIETIEELNLLEIFYIGYYDTFLGTGYNLNAGGGSQLGYKCSAKTKMKMSEAHKGKKLTDGHKRNIAEACSGKNNSMYGRKLSDEEKSRLFEARAKAVIIGDKYFHTVTEASEFIRISLAGLRKRILHNTKWLDYSYVKGGKSGGSKYL